MRTAHGRLELLLATTTLACALAAACGPSAPPAATPAAVAPPASAAPPGAAPPGEAAPSPPGAPAVSVEIVPSKMIADIKAIGIDLDKPVDLSTVRLARKL